MSSNRQDKVKVKDLNYMISRTGSMHRVKADRQNTSVMNGTFLFKDLGQGLSVHLVDVVELQTMQSSIELQPCLSINFVFEGELDFSLGGQRHHLATDADILCSAITLPQPDVMTRFLFENRRIRKFNIAIAYEWLEARCRTAVERAELSRLFSAPQRVWQWSPSPALTQVAQEMMRGEIFEGIAGELMLEQRVIALIGMSIDSLLQQIPVLPRAGDEVVNTAQVSPSFKALIDESIERGAAVADIASLCNISISTLQRRCKKHFGMTVNEYVRLRRLDMAKTALMVEGLSIGEEAYIAGYNHSSNFIAAFKRQFAMTPSELLRSHRG